MECPYVPVSERISFLYAEYGYLELDGHAVVLRQEDRCTHFPVGTAAAVLIMPGTVVTHAAVRACSESGCLLIWVGENGVRCYSSGNPGRDSANLLRQAACHLNPGSCLRAARSIFNNMFNEQPPQGRSIEQLRGLEGIRVKMLYRQLAQDCGIEWIGRTANAASSDPVNMAISCANAALYGLTEAVVLALGYAPSIGFQHRGNPRSFVFDVADCLKFKTVVPMAMKIASESTESIEPRVRKACRDLFSRDRVASRLVEITEKIIRDGLSSGS